jgi:hypothetical protein
MAMTGSLGSLGTRLRTATPRPHQNSHAGVPRGIANDLMTVEVEMADRIDGIADAAG